MPCKNSPISNDFSNSLDTLEECEPDQVFFTGAYELGSDCDISERIMSEGQENFFEDEQQQPKPTHEMETDYFVKLGMAAMEKPASENSVSCIKLLNWFDRWEKQNQKQKPNSKRVRFSDTDGCTPLVKSVHSYPCMYEPKTNRIFKRVRKVQTVSGLDDENDKNNDNNKVNCAEGGSAVVPGSKPICWKFKSKNTDSLLDCETEIKLARMIFDNSKQIITVFAAVNTKIPITKVTFTCMYGEIRGPMDLHEMIFSQEHTVTCPRTKTNCTFNLYKVDFSVSQESVNFHTNIFFGVYCKDEDEAVYADTNNMRFYHVAQSKNCFRL